MISIILISFLKKSPLNSRKIFLPISATSEFCDSSSSSWEILGELSSDLACLSRAAREELKLVRWWRLDPRLAEEATEDGRESFSSTSPSPALGEVISGN